MTERADQLHHVNTPASSTALVQAFIFGKTSHHPGLSAPPTAQILLSATYGFSPQLNSPLKERRFVNATVTQYTSPVNGVSLPTD
jgi:hypothetical protein